jgi:hypothetical protein
MLAASAGAAVFGGGLGGLIGAGLAKLVGDQHAHRLEEQLKHGGLWLRVWNAEDQRRAVEILSRRYGRDVHVHQE